MQPHRLLEQLDKAKEQQLISYYTIRHAVWGGDYYPQTMIYLQLPGITTDETIDRLCRHIQECYTVSIWNREYVHKSITIAYTNIDYCVSLNRQHEKV